LQFVIDFARHPSQQLFPAHHTSREPRNVTAGAVEKKRPTPPLPPAPGSEAAAGKATPPPPIGQAAANCSRRRGIGR
jgi:hypothetical protein